MFFLYSMMRKALLRGAAGGTWRPTGSSHGQGARARGAGRGQLGVRGLGVPTTRTRLPMGCFAISIGSSVVAVSRHGRGRVMSSVSRWMTPAWWTAAGRVEGRGQEWCGGSEFQRRYGYGTGTGVTKVGIELNWICLLANSNSLGSRKVE